MTASTCVILHDVKIIIRLSTIDFYRPPLYNKRRRLYDRTCLSFEATSIVRYVVLICRFFAHESSRPHFSADDLFFVVGSSPIHTSMIRRGA